MKASKKKAGRSKPATLKAKPPKARHPERVRGGKIAPPPPGGPVPIPYPNVAKS